MVMPMTMATASNPKTIGIVHTPFAMVAHPCVADSERHRDRKCHSESVEKRGHATSASTPWGT